MNAVCADPKRPKVVVSPSLQTSGPRYVRVETIVPFLNLGFLGLYIPHYSEYAQAWEEGLKTCFDLLTTSWPKSRPFSERTPTLTLGAHRLDGVFV